MTLRPLAFLTAVALALPALAQPAPAADPHAGHGAMTAAPPAAAANPAPPPLSTPPAAAPAPASAPLPAMGHAMTGHGPMPADRDRDGIPDVHEAHGAASAGGMGHGGGMGGCKMMGGKGGMMGGGHGAGGDDAFHRDLMARIDRLENRLILMETLLRERLRTP